MSLLVLLQEADPATPALRLGWAWTALLGLAGAGAVVLILLARQAKWWAVDERRRGKPTKVVDAWAEAGRRLEAEGPIEDDGKEP